jgi:tetratricopeptide (TPR) repeat protein
VLRECEEHFSVSAKSLYIAAQNCYKSTNDCNKAIALLTQAEEKEPYSSDIVYMLAKLYYEQEAYEKSKDALTRLTYTDYDESDGRAFVIAGDIEIKSGSPEKALEYYKKAFALDKYDIDTCFKMIYAYSELHEVENMHNTIEYVEDLISNTNIEELSDEEQCRLLYLRSAVDKIKDILRNHIEDI